jgi:hypothetical protein
MTFEPKIEGINPRYVFEFEDECGQCYIGGAGYMPDWRFAFYYADCKYEFCFYADQHWEGNEFEVEVKDATLARFKGGSPRIDPADFDRISRNMARFFATRWFLDPIRPNPPKEHFRSLKLSWVLR